MLPFCLVQVIREIEEVIGLDCSNILQVSAKMGLGIEAVLEAIVQVRGSNELSPLAALFSFFLCRQ